MFGKDECEIIPKIIQKDLSPRSSLPETFVTVRCVALPVAVYASMSSCLHWLVQALTDGPRRKGSLTAMVNYYRNAFTPASLLMQLPLVECPVSILWGERDHALGRDLAEASAAYVKNRSTRYADHSRSLSVLDLGYLIAVCCPLLVFLLVVGGDMYRERERERES